MGDGRGHFGRVREKHYSSWVGQKQGFSSRRKQGEGLGIKKALRRKKDERVCVVQGGPHEKVMELETSSFTLACGNRGLREEEKMVDEAKGLASRPRPDIEMPEVLSCLG